jgi:hypothetical protein
MEEDRIDVQALNGLALGARPHAHSMDLPRLGVQLSQQRSQDLQPIAGKVWLERAGVSVQVAADRLRFVTRM